MNKFLIALLLLPLVTAQTEILSDPAGDVEKQVAGTNASLPISENLDLRFLTIAETFNTFDFQLEMDSLETTNLLESAAYLVYFEHNGAQFRARSDGQTPAQGGEMFFFGNLQEYDVAQDQWTNIRAMDVTVADATISFQLQRDWLLDGNGAAPFPGRTLENIHVESASNLNGFDVNGPLIQFTDEMPDDQNYGTWDIVLGLKQEGSLRLESFAPVRASNGEATTYVFQVFLKDLQAQEQFVTLSTTQLPPEWAVQLPADELLLPANKTLPITAIVSIPFKHSHGAFESFILEATSQDGHGVGRVEIGVRYTEIAQPAGHHNTIFLHTATNGPNPLSDVQDTVLGSTTSVIGTMNTEEFYDLDTKQEYAAIGNGVGSPGIFQWTYSLSPSLVLGLDFDLEAQGELSVIMESSLGLTDAKLTGTLFHAQCQTGANGGCPFTNIGSFDSEPVDVTSSGVTINAIFTPTTEADYIEYSHREANIFLQLQLEVPTVTQTLVQPPRILPGGYMVLPLNEYHDPVEKNLVSLSDLEFFATSAVERAINPTETALYNFTLENTGLVRENYLLEVAGSNNWARILGATDVSLNPGDDRRVVVAVTVAEDATDATVTDYVVKATSTRDASLQGLVPFRAVVDTVFDQKDESGLILDTEKELYEKSLPGFGAPLLIAALLLARRSKL